MNSNKKCCKERYPRNFKNMILKAFNRYLKIKLNLRKRNTLHCIDEIQKLLQNLEVMRDRI
jgi:hypothetical protein